MEVFSDLPALNPHSYPSAIEAVTTASIRSVILHYAHGGSTSPRQHLIAAGLELMTQVTKISDLNLRRAIERAGYGFSRFYKLWPNLGSYHFDVWRFGLKCHSMSEMEHLRQLGGGSLDDFADVLARHLVLAQHLLSPAIFKHLMAEYANNDLMTMLAHVPEHARATETMFVSLFPEEAAALEIDRLMDFAWMAGTYLFSRLLDEQRSISDEAAIDVLKKQLLLHRPS
jgi:hypothetical protein